VTIPANKAELTDKNHDTISLNDSYNQHVSQESFGNKQNYNYSNSNESSNHQGSTWSSSSTEECPSEAVVDVIIHQNIPTLSNPIKHGWEKAAKFHSQTPSQNSKTHHTSKSQPWSIHHAHGRHQSAPTLNTRNATSQTSTSDLRDSSIQSSPLPILSSKSLLVQNTNHKIESCREVMKPLHENVKEENTYTPKGEASKRKEPFSKIEHANLKSSSQILTSSSSSPSSATTAAATTTTTIKENITNGTHNDTQVIDVDYTPPWPKDAATIAIDITSHNTNPIELKPIDPDPEVQIIDEVEWANQNDHTSNNNSSNSGKFLVSIPPREMATRPKFRIEDPCGCSPQYDNINDKLIMQPCCVDDTCVLFACQEECHSNCEAGELCRNKRITLKKWKNVQVVDAGLKGRGLCADEHISSHDFVIEYTGLAVKKSYLDQLFKRYRMEKMLYIMALDGDVYIDARKKGSLARYINHSCEPNCAVHRWKVKGISRAAIFALKDIKKGEELTFDYKWDRKRGRAPTKCHCNTPTCRGTLEVPMDKTREEEDLDKLLNGHWSVLPKDSKPGNEIINRTIKVLSKEDQDFYLADISAYNPITGLHCIVYRGGEVEEYWKDLSSKGDLDWMILDENMEQFVIARKLRRPETPKTLSVRIPSQTSSISNSPVPGQKRNKDFIIVPTHIKEKLIQRQVMNRAHRHYRVQISTTLVAKSPNERKDYVDSEEEEEAKILSTFEDNVGWKLKISGLQPAEAQEFLLTNISTIQKEDITSSEKLKYECSHVNGSLDNNIDSQSLPLHTIAESLYNSKVNGGHHHNHNLKQEIILPECTVVHINKKIPIFRKVMQRYYTNISLLNFETHGKGFTKILLFSTQGNLENLQSAQDFIWKELLTICNKENAPRISSERFKDLSFCAGTLSAQQFTILHHNFYEKGSTLKCKEDKINRGGRRSPTLKSSRISQQIQQIDYLVGFEYYYKCPIWVQFLDDSEHNGSSSYASKKYGPCNIYFGCKPDRIPDVWERLQDLLKDMTNGVKYFPLGREASLFSNANKLIVRNISDRDLELFSFISKISRASLSFDPIAFNHIRIDATKKLNSNAHQTNENAYEATYIKGATKKDENLASDSFLKLDHTGKVVN